MTKKGTQILKDSEIIMVESVEIAKSGWAVIGADNGRVYKYKLTAQNDIPSLFSTIKVWYTTPGTKNGSWGRRVIRKWALFTEDIVVDNEPIMSESDED